MVKRLLSAASDVNAEDNGVVSLMFASGKSHFEVVKVLLDKRVDGDVNGTRATVEMEATALCSFGIACQFPENYRRPGIGGWENRWRNTGESGEAE